MVRTSALWLSALAFTASSVHALPSADTVPRAHVPGGLKAGHFTLPAAKINGTNLTIRPRGLRSSAAFGVR
jgi:hypothetical protein